eukprot:SAG11_NODE_7280_length_1167_cov_0.677903_2_plen_177_part_01
MAAELARSKALASQAAAHTRALTEQAVVHGEQLGAAARQLDSTETTMEAEHATRLARLEAAHEKAAQQAAAQRKADAEKHSEVVLQMATSQNLLLARHEEAEAKGKAAAARHAVALEAQEQKYAELASLHRQGYGRKHREAVSKINGEWEAKLSRHEAVATTAFDLQQQLKEKFADA